MSRPEPYAINISDDVLADLRIRLGNTRWPEPAFADDWSAGASVGYLQHLMEYWRDSFDWRARERELNEFPHFRVAVDDFIIHYIHLVRGSSRSRLPLILTHGWPNTFADLLKLVPLLARDFDLIIPSLPGYGFSEVPLRPLAFRETPDVWHRLATEVLGYQRIGAYGYDLGAWVTARLAIDHPESVVGIHMSQVSGGIGDIDSPSAVERAWMEESARWDAEDAAYSLMHETRPVTASVGLTDSPAGLAAWIVEKLREWSDCGGDVERRWSKDDICSLLTIYWGTGTVASSFRAYYDLVQDPSPKPWPEGVCDVPAGFAMFPGDITPPPRERAERRWKILRWTEMPAGGHFPAVEEPDALAHEIQAFYATLNRRSD